MMRAYILAPFAAVATLVVPMLVVVLLIGADVPETFAAAWLLSVPMVALGLPLAFAGELVLVLVARASGHHPLKVEPTSILLATGILGPAVGGGLWLASGTELPPWIALLPLVASLAGGATFLRLRQPFARDVEPVVPTR